MKSRRANGEGSIYKDNDRYKGYITLGRKRIVKSLIRMNCTPFGRQCNIMSAKWGAVHFLGVS